MGLHVKDFMSTPVVTAEGETTVGDIREIMKENGIHAIPIISYTNDTLKVEVTIQGIVTASDLSKDISESSKVEDVMTTSSLHVLHSGCSATAAAKMMLKHEVHHIVVMDAGKIKGMISSMDFVKLVAEHSLE